MIELEPWIPYMGNKASLLGNIEATIKQLAIPNPTCIVDAFCGGGSFGYYMATHGYKVIMNDLDPGVINLHKTLQMHPEWLELFKQVAPTKDEFKACVNGNSDYDAYIKYIWSFGTKGDTYLTSLENEKNKIEEYWRGEAEPNSRVKHLEDIVLMYAHCQPDITFVNGSYEDLEIPEGALVYADPPYINTGEYLMDSFDHGKFYQWLKEQKEIVLISEYSMPDEFPLIDAYTKNCVMAGADGRKATVEKLFANRELPLLRLF